MKIEVNYITRKQTANRETGMQRSCSRILGKSMSSGVCRLRLIVELTGRPGDVLQWNCCWFDNLNASQPESLISVDCYSLAPLQILTNCFDLRTSPHILKIRTRVLSRLRISNSLHLLWVKSTYIIRCFAPRDTKTGINCHFLRCANAPSTQSVRTCTNMRLINSKVGCSGNH